MLAFIVSNITSIFFGFKLGLKKERQVRIRRVNALRKLLNGKV
jgi:hypothetical protein